MTQKLKLLSPLHKATRLVGTYLQPRCAELGVSNPEGHLLSYLQSYGPCSITRLHEVFGHRRSTLTSMLDRLEARSLIRRELDPGDRRSFQVSITAGGRRTAGRLRTVLEELESDVLGRVSNQDLAGFAAVMAAIAHVTNARAPGKEEE